jgi:hypothetical protein
MEGLTFRNDNARGGIAHFEGMKTIVGNGKKIGAAIFAHFPDKVRAGVWQTFDRENGLQAFAAILGTG